MTTLVGFRIQGDLACPVCHRPIPWHCELNDGEMKSSPPGMQVTAMDTSSTGVNLEVRVPCSHCHILVKMPNNAWVSPND